ncbi:MAG: RibD family protein [Zetaproteobacteria bacterium]|nr:MAG: RibD family protein [Zetaproteobacteria bacterium]
MLAGEAAALNRPFLSWVQRGRPWVLAKAAVSVDGMLATGGGESQWITGASARRAAHRLRAEADAIIVGAGTLRADNPQLTVRGVARRAPPPLRVVIARTLPAFSPHWRIADGQAPSRIYAMEIPEHEARAWTQAGVEVKPFRTLPEVIADLGREGRLALMVEGGGKLIGALLDAQLVDEMVLFVAPILIGGRGRPLWDGVGAGHLGTAPRLTEIRHRRCGADLMIRGLVAYTG